jgi:uncharacterized protein (TIGR00290 family)
MPLRFDPRHSAGGTIRPTAAISWSGGKDSFAALDRTRAAYDVVAMVTMFDEGAERSRSHGLRPEVIAAQAGRLALEPFAGRCEWQTYDRAFSQVLDRLATRGVTHVIFGDILFEEHRRWAGQMCEHSGLTAVEPLWGSSTEALFEEWVSSGADALIVTARAEFLDDTWLGRPLRREMAEEFARLGVDPCGERGEYHTVVTGGHLFSAPLRVRLNGHVQRSGCWALDLMLADTPEEPATPLHNGGGTGDPTRAAGD